MLRNREASCDVSQTEGNGERYGNRVFAPDGVGLGSPNFFSLRATLTPPLSPKGQT
jgi:hypothetical protein